MFHYTVETDKTLDETLMALANSLKARGFGVLWEMNMTAKLQEKGLDFTSPYRILEVCNPHEAKRVLDFNPLAGYFLPCKIVVYEDAGRVKIGMPKPTLLINLAEEPDMAQIAQDVENHLVAAIDEAK